MALIPTFFPDCVVAIGTYANSEMPVWLASGFFYGYRVSPENSDDAKYRVFLVTNRHVFDGLSAACVRVNPEADEPARVYNLDLQDKQGKTLWRSHPRSEVDLAVVPVNFSLLKEELMQAAFFTSDKHSASIDKMIELGICEGDFAYVLGFPMALVGDKRNAVIVRGGSIARIRDTLAKANSEFLVDAFIFPGNSGGPVISKPEVVAIKGTKSQNSAYLIGVVKSYVPYQDVAVSRQTGQPRVIFEENSGLTAAHPIDYIDEVIEEHLKTKADLPEPESTPPQEP
ncbi:MAG: serine protease [Dehalococcoidia bacterium]